MWHRDIDENSFGPISVREVPDEVPTDERTKIMTQVAKDNRAIRLVYDQVKQKIRDLWQSSDRGETLRKWSINDWQLELIENSMGELTRY